MSDRVVSGGDLTPEQLRVHRVEHILRRDGGSPGGALDGLASIVEDESWRKVPSGPDAATPFPSFRAFVEAGAPFGLGYSIKQLRALMQLQHPAEAKQAAVRGRMEATRLAVEELLREEIPIANPAGRPNKERATLISGGPESETAERITRRLKRDDPDLAALVVAGEITAHAAARMKGWRKARIVVSSPEKTAESLRKHMSPDARLELARLLAED